MTPLSTFKRFCKRHSSPVALLITMALHGKDKLALRALQDLRLKHGLYLTREG